MAAPTPQPRKDLSMAGLLATVRTAFDTVPDTRRTASTSFTMNDTLNSALAMFSLKCSSLLHFDTDMRADAGTIRHNLKTLFGVSQAPCDTQMREILDPVGGLEHSYGHGKQFLCSTLSGLMLLAFLIDEIQELSCRLFQAARAAHHARTAIWEKLRAC